MLKFLHTKFIMLIFIANLLFANKSHSQITIGDSVMVKIDTILKIDTTKVGNNIVINKYLEIIKTKTIIKRANANIQKLKSIELKSIYNEQPNYFDNLVFRKYNIDRSFATRIKKKSSILLSASFSIFNNQNTFKSNNYQQVTNAANLNSLLKNKTSFGLDLQISYFQKNFLLGTGINFFTIQESFNNNNFLNPQYNYFQTKYTQTETILEYYTIENGQITKHTINQDKEYSKKDSSLVDIPQSKNSYSYISIPFNIGYKIENNKLIYSLKTGIAANFLLAADGKYLSSNGKEIIELKNNNVFSDFNLSFLLSIDVMYKIKNNWYFMLTPYYKNTINTTKSNYGVKINNNIIGLSFGLSYFL